MSFGAAPAYAVARCGRAVAAEDAQVVRRAAAAAVVGGQAARRLRHAAAGGVEHAVEPAERGVSLLCEAIVHVDAGAGRVAMSLERYGGRDEELQWHVITTY